MDDQHPADGIVDGIVEHVRGLINGDALKQGVRDAWDRMTTGGQSQQSAHDKAVADMNAQANAHKNDSANASFIKPDVAATIRKKAAK